ncbi:hypothetical protein TON_0300 [Thermococcus onnurineus NA1]|uniref:Uncharacterized protein n=1 Tax=Thermococcus onnurineus (strain NA1) TaxID=523850 RepID=B6YT98_THEON|nr:hypothetical protein [Thermococcus onnurineus]ACJ15785.1 hypothetical protein TON_0300 [Thermococcus onnurineus NA1]
MKTSKLARKSSWHLNGKIDFKFGKFYFNPDAPEFIKRALQRDGKIMVYDEIGYLEMLGYFDVFRYIKGDCIFIVRKDLLNEMSGKVKFDALFEVTLENREWVWKDVVRCFNTLSDFSGSLETR